MIYIRSSFSEGDKLLLMKMGLGLASSTRFIWVTLFSVGCFHEKIERCKLLYWL